MKIYHYLFALILMGFGVEAQTLTESEPNDTRTDSGVKYIYQSTTISGTIEAGGSDFYLMSREDVMTDAYYDAEINTSTLPANVQVWGQLYSGGYTGGQIGSNFDLQGSFNSWSAAWRDVDRYSGFYVYNPTGSPISYSIEVNGQNGDYPSCPDAGTSGNYTATATTSTVNLVSFDAAANADGYIVVMNSVDNFTDLTEDQYGLNNVSVTGTAWQNSGEQVIADVSSNSPSLTVTGLALNTTYYFKVIPYRECYGYFIPNNGSSSSSITTPKAAPTITVNDIIADYGDGNISLAATTNSDGALSYSLIGASTGTSVSGSTLTLGDPGIMTLRASTAETATYEAGEKDVTLSINKLTGTVTLGSLSQTYDGNPKAASATTSPGTYTVDFTYNGSSTAPTNAGSYTVVGAINDTYYEGSTGSTLTIEKADQTISFGTLTNKTFGDSNFDLTATASSGNSVTYVSSNTDVASISGSTVTIVGGGSTDITASQAGDDNYNAASDVVQSLTVNKASQTISFSALADKTVGDGDFSISATASSGLGVSFTSLDETVATVSGSTVSIVGSGTVTIRASQAGDADYLAASDVDQTLTVNEALTQVTVNSSATGICTKEVTITLESVQANVDYYLLNDGTASVMEGPISGSAGADISFTTQTTTSDITYRVRAQSSTETLDMTTTPVITVDAPADQTVNLTQPDGHSATVSLASSEVGLNYFLQNSITDDVLQGPLAGTGAGISFSTQEISENTTFKVATSESISLTSKNTLKFDDTGHVTIPGTLNNSLSSASDITVETWAYIPSADNSGQITGIISQQFNGTIRFALYIDASAGDGSSVLKGGFYDGSAWREVSSVYSNDEWMHIAGTYNGSTVRLYINGDEVGTLNHSAALPNATDGWYIGRRWDDAGSGNQIFSGELADTRIWNVTRTQSQIANSMTTLNAGDRTGLVLEYNYIDGTGSTVSDDSGNSYDGTLTNFTATDATNWSSFGGASCNFEMTTTPSATFSEIEITSSEVTLNAPDLAFDGSSKPFTVTVDAGISSKLTSSDIDLTYEGRNGTSYTLSSTAPTNVGDYTVYATVQAANAYYFGTVSTDFRIAPEADLSGFVDFSAMVLDSDVILSVPSASGVNIVFSIENAGGAEASLSGTNGETLSIGSIGGSVTIRATVDDPSYDVTFKDITLTINKLNPVLTWADFDVEYGTTYGEAQKTATADVDGTFQYIYDFFGETSYPLTDFDNGVTELQPIGNTISVNVGFTPTNTGTYNSVSALATVTVVKANIEITANDATFYIDQTPQFNYTVTVGEIGLVHTLTVPLTSETVTGAGTYQIIESEAYSGDCTSGISISRESSGGGGGGSGRGANPDWDVIDSDNSKDIFDIATAMPSGHECVISEFYNSITFVPGTLTIIDKTGVTIALDISNLNRTYTGLEQSVAIAGITANADGSTVSPSTTVFYEGISGTTYVKSATPPTLPGDYLVTAAVDDADPNHYSNTVSESLTIDKAPLTITANSRTITYGEDITAGATASITGFVNSETESVLTGSLIFEDLESYTQVGTYTESLGVDGYTSDNYDITYVDGDYTVNKALLTITASSHTITYGDAEPTYSVTYSGFQFGEDETEINEPTGVSLDAMFGDAGTYTTQVNQDASATNYEISYVDGALIIEKVSATVSISGATFTYDGNPKIITATTTPSGYALDYVYEGINGTIYSQSSTAPTDAGEYQVTATINETNYVGSNSATFTIEQESQTIIFNTLPVQNIVENTTLDLTATGGASGNAVTYASSDPGIASISGSTVTFHQVGSVDITASQAGSTNYVAASDVIQSLTITEDYIWSGTAWNSGSMPPSDKDVYFNGDYTMSADMTTASVYVSTGVTLTIADGVTLTDNNEVYNDGAVIVQSGGSLRLLGTAIGTNFQFERNVTGNLGYSVVGNTVEVTTGEEITNAPDIMYTYENDAWNASSLPAAAQGYFVAYNSATPVFTMRGAPLTGSQNYAVTYTNDATANDYELTANPYNSSISHSSFISTNGSAGSGVIDGFIYLWEDGGFNNPDGTRAGSYVTVASDGTPVGGSFDGFIRSGQGFFVNAAATGNVSYTAAMQTAGNNADGGFFRHAVSSIKLSLSNDTYSDELLVSLNEGATNGIDVGLDGNKFMNSGLSFYSMTEGHELAVQAISNVFEAEVIIPMAYQSATSGEFMLQVAELKNIPYGMEIFLEDTETCEQYDLRNQNQIGVMLSTSGNEGRFNLILRTSKVLGTEDIQAELYVYGSPSNVKVYYSAASPEEKVMIYDLNGRVIFSERIRFESGIAILDKRFMEGTIYILRIGEELTKFSLN